MSRPQPAPTGSALAPVDTNSHEPAVDVQRDVLESVDTSVGGRDRRGSCFEKDALRWAEAGPSVENWNPFRMERPGFSPACARGIEALVGGHDANRELCRLEPQTPHSSVAGDPELEPKTPESSGCSRILGARVARRRPVTQHNICYRTQRICCEKFPCGRFVRQIVRRIPYWREASIVCNRIRLKAASARPARRRPLEPRTRTRGVKPRLTPTSSALRSRSTGP
jgi:hypothetical protein